MTEQKLQKRQEMDLSKTNISSLAHLCRQATDRYFLKQVYDDRFCLELFRRAIEEKDETAWTIVLDQYENLVQAWVLRHHSFPLADEDANYFINRTFDSFWSAFSRDPSKLAKFNNLKSLLQYLKLCTYTAVQSYVDRRMPPRHINHSDRPMESIAESVNAIDSVDDNMIAGIVWQYVQANVKTQQERIIAEEFLIYNMKPQEIFSRHPEDFSDVGHVRRVKGNLMTRLRRSKQLRSIVSGIE